MHVRKNYAALQIVSITIIIVPKMAFKKGSNNLWWLATARLDGITELSINNTYCFILGLQKELKKAEEQLKSKNMAIFLLF